MKSKIIALATALTAAGLVLAGCQATTVPDVRFPAAGLTVSIPGMVVGQEVSETLPAATGGESLVYSLSPDVPGLVFDPATRVLSGVPTTPGVYEMTYTAKDSETGGTMESVEFTVTVAAAPRANRERILGTWRAVRGWEDDYHGVENGTIMDYVTFTASRFVLLRGHYDDSDNFVEAWHREGTWEIGADEIVAVWLDDHDDDWETPAREIRLAKSYVLLSDDDLILDEWAHDGEYPTPDRMTRVDVSAYIPPIGAWGRVDDEVVVTITVAADGAFTWRTVEPEGIWLFTASWTHDPDHLFLNLSNASATWTPTGLQPEEDPNVSPTTRLAYVPSPLIAGEVAIRVSGPYPESMPDRFPYGGYWDDVTLQGP